MLFHSLLCYKQCPWSLFPARLATLIHTPLLLSSPQGADPDQVLCTVNIRAPVVKSCFFSHVFLPVPSSPSSRRAPLTGPAASCLLPLHPQEHLALPDSSSPVTHPRHGSCCPQGRSKPMSGPHPSFLDLSLTIPLVLLIVLEFKATLLLCVGTLPF